MSPLDKAQKFSLPKCLDEKNEQLYSDFMKSVIRELLEDGFQLRRRLAILKSRDEVEEDWNDLFLHLSTITGLYMTKDGKVIIRSRRCRPIADQYAYEIHTLSLPGAEKETEA